MDKLLVIEDNDEIRKQLKWGLSKEYTILLAKDVNQALSLFEKHNPKVVTLDLGLSPHEDSADEGFRCLEEIIRHNPCTKVIILTANNESRNALDAVRMGAYDYYQKPIELSDLRVILRRAFYLYDLEYENRQLHMKLEKSNMKVGKLIGQCSRMEEVFSTIRKVAASDISVLIQGESGTGKELVSRAIHCTSMRSEQPFIPINCGAIPENLLESELFGHEKGAFTGAHSQIQGKVEYAHKGVLFLDEIGELPVSLQVKLLRFLQEKTIQRVGGRDDIHVDARIIAATNSDLSKAIQEGKFREDLYYRIGVITINLPPLRERDEDVLLLSNLFLRRFSEEFKKKVNGFSKASLELIQNYMWPGNVRELENRIQRAVIMTDSPIIEPLALGFDGKIPNSRWVMNGCVTLREARERAEVDIVSAAIEKNKGNIARTAEYLGISRPTLYDLMRKHGLTHHMHE